VRAVRRTRRPRHDELAPYGRRRQHAVIRQQVRSRPRHERREPGQEVERLEHDRRGAVAPASAEGVDHFAIGGERESVELDRWASHVPTQPLEPITIVGCDADFGVQRETVAVTAQLARQRVRAVELARSTMCDWITGICERLMPLRAHLMTAVLACDVVHADDTPLLCLENAEGRGKSRAALWVYRSLKATLFDLRPNRSRDGPSRMLANWKGHLVSDAYSGFDEIHRKGDVIEVGCMAHARRKYFEALPTSPEDSSRMLASIQSLYAIEKEARESCMDVDALTRHRKEKARAVVDVMKRDLDDMATRALPRSMLGEAITYMQRQWVALTRFVDDGRLPIDNMPAERAIRGVAVGRKNWLFAGSFAGGERAALVYSLIETCRQHGVEPFAYFRDVLERVPTIAEDQIAELTPWAWKAAAS